jgi:hypothetical protein
MRVVAGLIVALIGLASQACSSSTTAAQTVQCPAGQHALSTSCAWDPVVVTLGPSLTTDGCPVFSPNPVSAHTNQVVQWVNNNSASRTVYQFEGFNNGVAPVPLTSVNPGQTSGGIFWSSAGSILVYLSGCPSNQSDWGAITITVG